MMDLSARRMSTGSIEVNKIGTRKQRDSECEWKSGRNRILEGRGEVVITVMALLRPFTRRLSYRANYIENEPLRAELDIAS